MTTPVALGNTLRSFSKSKWQWFKKKPNKTIELFIHNMECCIKYHKALFYLCDGPHTWCKVLYFAFTVEALLEQRHQNTSWKNPELWHRLVWNVNMEMCRQTKSSVSWKFSEDIGPFLSCRSYDASNSFFFQNGIKSSHGKQLYWHYIWCMQYLICELYVYFFRLQKSGTTTSSTKCLKLSRMIRNHSWVYRQHLSISIWTRYLKTVFCI